MSEPGGTLEYRTDGASWREWGWQQVQVGDNDRTAPFVIAGGTYSAGDIVVRQRNKAGKASDTLSNTRKVVV